MDEVVLFEFAASYAANQSPLVARDDESRHRYLAGCSQMRDLAKSAREQGGLGELNEHEPRLSSSGRMMGGGPFMQYLATLDLSFATAAALAFLRVARPIMIEYLKNRRGSFKFKDGDVTLECEGVECLEKIETYIAKIATRGNGSPPRETDKTL